MNLLATLNKIACIYQRYARLLHFLTRIDLNKQLWVHPLLCNLPGNRFGNPWSVNSVNGIEQPNRVSSLVGLQRPDQMKFYARMPGLQIWPFGSRLLHPVFTKDVLAICKNGHDIWGFKGFTDSNQGNFGTRSTNRFGCPFDPVSNVLQCLMRV